MNCWENCPWDRIHNTLFSWSLTNWSKKLEYLSLTNFSSLAYCLQVGHEPTRVKHLGDWLQAFPKIRLEKHGRNKHSSLLGPIESYKENELLRIQTLVTKH
jgi:hypothetical protein